MRQLVFAFALLSLALATAAPAAAGAICTEALDVAAPVLANGFAADRRNTRRYASAITADNVATLQLAWVDVAAGSTEKRGTPAVTEQAVFFSAGRRIVAADRRSGCRYWEYEIPAKTTPLVGSNAVRSSAIYFVAPDGDRPALVLAGDFYGNFYALNAADGRLRWSRFLGTERDHHMITGAPQLADGKLLVPVSSKEVLSTIVELLRPCCSSHGLLQALDPYTGTTLWTYHATADARYQFGSGKMAPNGVSLWGTPAVDLARRRVYVGTGQNLTPPTTDNSDAVLALDLDSGAPLWTFQATAGDAFNVGCELNALLGFDCVRPGGPDFDFGAPPMLVHTSAGDAVIAGAKNGVVYSLDPDRGTPNWSRRVGAGGTLGGIHWGMASDEARVYVAVSDVTTRKSSGLSIGQRLEKAQITPVEGARPGIYALDAASGALLWETHPTHPADGVPTPSIYSAALSLSNDLLFAGALDGELLALRASDGAERWRHASAVPVTGVDGSAGNGGTIDSVGAIAAGDSLLLNSGYDTFGSRNAHQAGPGNALYVWRLPPP
ncbi:outer membrane protein assembly factor BamB family protein [Solimonas variicoloris]|uniref:outer membrane protein assembly factor BamB family protein n=1 Tax=Solimonas variicoloris TaxID=254408 RepID=UPI00036C13EB|nr:PQQ-binding-like beta-propeller repeat protein [Solimonas variicoloris]